MKNFIIIIGFVTAGSLQAQHFGFSSGIYRIPYANNVDLDVHSDVYSHSPTGKYDLLTDASQPVIVAAADGWVRWIVEEFDTTCHNGTTCCWEFNNYVVIEHPNGEWSQYTHMDQGSVSGAGITLNEWVTAGTQLGTEGTVGCSTEDHLHFEVSRPFDPAVPFDTIGGFLNCICSNGGNIQIAEMLIPVIAGIGTVQPWMADGDAVEGGPLDDDCATTVEVIVNLGNGDEYVARADGSVLSNNANTVTFSNGSSSVFRAGDQIQLRPGFHAQIGAKFTAIIRGCNQQN